MKQYAGRLADPEVRRCYWVWASMIQRCTNPKDRQFHNYGGRGIGVHPSWMNFDNFIADMGLRPTPQHTLERDHNDLDYGKDNCLWATVADQAKNHRARLRAEPLPTGVTRRPNGKYQARIGVGGSHIYLGVFDTPDMASQAVRAAHWQHGFNPRHGEARA